MQVMNRFKELDLEDRFPEELRTEVSNTTGGSDQNHPKGKDIPTEGRVPENNRER